MPQLTIDGHGTVDVPAGMRLVRAIEGAGFDILHRCGGFARCTTCRVLFVAGEPPRMTRAEHDKLESKGDLGQYRLSCQCLVTHDMTVRPLRRLSTSGLDDAGPEPEVDITPEPEWMATPRPNLPEWPQNAAAWRQALAAGVGIDPEEGRRLHAGDGLPREAVAEWLETTYAADRGYHPDFVPALLRNLGGLLAWAYGEAAEPYWSKSDEDQTGE